nr:histidine kinase dimerization/phosphoacceptor domain -containing protein [Rhizobium sp. TH2]
MERARRYLRDVLEVRDAKAITMVHKRLHDDSNVEEVAFDEYLTGLLEQFKATVDSAADRT